MSTCAISVVIPTYRRPVQLAACLRALAASDYPHDQFEVLVVDDGGGVSLEGALAPVRDRLHVTLLPASHGGPAAACNVGIAAARGALIAITSDDCLVDAHWLSALAQRQARCPGCLLGGRTLNALPGSPCSSASQLLIDAVYAHYNADPEQARFFAGNNMAAPAEDLRAMGGFDETGFPRASEDRDLCARWLESGRRMVYAPEALVRHAHVLSLPAFFRQHVGYGRGARCFQRALARRGAVTAPMQPASFYLHLLRYPFGRQPWLPALRLAALILLSQMASALGWLLERAGERRAAR